MLTERETDIKTDTEIKLPKYKIMEINVEWGWTFIKIMDGEFKFLMLRIFKIGCDKEKLYFKMYIVNNKIGIDRSKLNKIVDKIVYDLFFSKEI